MKTLIYTLSLFVTMAIIGQTSHYNSNINYLANTESSPFEFDTASYLPENFDPYKGMIEDNSYLLIEEPVVFDFNTASYLPENFDSYEGMIIYNTVQLEEEPEFDFDRKAYLPKDFNPFKCVETKTDSAS